MYAKMLLEYVWQKIMKHDNLKNFKLGWFIGNFEPAILKTNEFEIAIKQHDANEYIEPHYQKIATEYNYLISGDMTANGKRLVPGDIFVFEPGEVCNVQVHSYSEVVCIKTPSLGDSDKVVVND